MSTLDGHYNAKAEFNEERWKSPLILTSISCSSAQFRFSFHLVHLSVVT